jgi:hypothetical protein
VNEVTSDMATEYQAEVERLAKLLTAGDRYYERLMLREMFYYREQTEEVLKTQMVWPGNSVPNTLSWLENAALVEAFPPVPVMWGITRKGDDVHKAIPRM